MDPHLPPPPPRPLYFESHHFRPVQAPSVLLNHKDTLDYTFRASCHGPSFVWVTGFGRHVSFKCRVRSRREGGSRDGVTLSKRWVSGTQLLVLFRSRRESRGEGYHLGETGVLGGEGVGPSDTRSSLMS